jgi:hypothetical protein
MAIGIKELLEMQIIIEISLRRRRKKFQKRN